MSQGHTTADASLGVTYGTKWGRPEDVRRLLGTSSGRNFSEWVGAYWVTKRKP